MKFLLSGLTVFPARPMTVMKLAKEAGFDGVELLLAGSVLRGYDLYEKIAADVGLSIHFHEAWTASEATTPSLLWKVLEKVGYLPNDCASLGNKVPPMITGPVVIYANESTHGVLAPNYHYQTISVMNGANFKMSYRCFLEMFNSFPVPIVFDTYHFLEWRAGHSDSLEDCTSADFLDLLMAGFETFKDHIKEIHLADWGPKLGRNCRFGEGNLPLQEFCQFVRRSGWGGVVTPEINSIYYFTGFRRRAELQKMLAKVKELFGQ